MIKQFQKVKILILFSMLLCSSLLIICPSGESGPLDQIYECKPLVVIEYDEALLQEPIVPYDEPREIPITIKAKIYGPTADIILEKIGIGDSFDEKDTKLIIDLSVEEVSEGCLASINPPLMTKIGVSDEFLSANATLSITIDQYLPAFSLKNVKIKMVSRKMGRIVADGEFIQDIPFIVGYQPQLSFSYPKSNVVAIGPDEIANFLIDVENWGNADTQLDTEIVDLPDGWLAEIVNSTVLVTNLVHDETSKKTISLDVKPPRTFGYHEERAIIKVKMTPVYYNDSSYSGEPHYLYFIVQSKGFSTPGFEMSFILFAFIFVLIPILKQRNNKAEGKKSRRHKE